jgi:hypothetical protein
MADKRLIGEDASLYKFVAGATKTGDGSTITLTAGKIYKITAKATSSSIFPAGFAVGDYYYATTAAVLASGDICIEQTETLVSDCKSWTMTVSSDEVEVTVLADSVKKYRKGKSDVSGTITGIAFTSELGKAGSVNNRFIKTVAVTMGTAPVANDVFAIDSSDYFIKAYLNEDDVSGNTQVFILAQIELLGYNWGAEMGNAQEWSSDIRMIGVDPVMFAVTNA